MPSSVATNGSLIPKPISGPHIVYGFLTPSRTTSSRPIHPKAMPVILTMGCKGRCKAMA
jgi:hypothetical protein